MSVINATKGKKINKEIESLTGNKSEHKKNNNNKMKGITVFTKDGDLTLSSIIRHRDC